MKAVAPNAFLVKRVGEREGLLDLRRGAVKSGIEACHLRQFGIEAHRHLDRREMVRLVQWRGRHERFQLGQQFRRDAGGPGAVQTAMDDTVAECVKPPVAKLFSGPRQSRRKHLTRHCRRFLPEIRGVELFAIEPSRARRRMCADPIDLAAENSPLAFVKTELDGRGAGIDYADHRLRSCCFMLKRG
jgi:hypothetical protein